jgi:hypothetical protein
VDTSRGSLVLPKASLWENPVTPRLIKQQTALTWNNTQLMILDELPLCIRLKKILRKIPHNFTLYLFSL